MENEGLVSFLRSSGVVIERPGDKTGVRDQRSDHPFTLEPLSDEAAVHRGTVLGCVFALLVLATAGMLLFAGVHALLTGHAF